MDPYGAHAHGQIRPERPHGIGFEGEEEHGHEKTPVLKKVKDKVKKIKDTISKKTHGHDEHTSEEEYEDDLDVEEVEMETDHPEVHGAPMYESAAAVLVTETGTGTGTEHKDHVNRGYESLGEVLGRAEEDPAAPDSRTRASAPSDQSKLLSSSTGSDVVGADSPITRSFQNMSVSGERQAEKEALQPPPEGGLPHGTDEEAKETDVEKAPPTYTEKLTSTATAAKEAATTVYNRVAEAGTAAMGRVQSQTAAGGPAGTAESGGKATGAGMKDYLLDKLRPGEEDRALSEVISDAMHAKKQEVVAVVETTAPGGGGVGAGVVDKIKGVLSSFLGGAGRVSGTSTPPAAEADEQQVGGSGVQQEEEDTKKQA